MRRYLLDTTIVSAYLFNIPYVVNLIAPWIEHHEVATSVLVYAEVVEYLRSRSNFSRRLAELQALLKDIHPYTLSYPILEEYSAVRRALRTQGRGLIGDVDSFIAATALVRRLTIVTSDTDFQRVPGLSVQLIARHLLQR